MKILYIFPHPDDESYGPASLMYQQQQDGHQVYLLTLTKGGATKVRHGLGLSIDAMGEIRYQEMLDVAKVLELTHMEVWDFADSGLAELDPRILENAIKKYVRTIEPDVIVTYPVHGISGFHDHLVTHAVVKRIYLELKEEGVPYLKRLAFYTIPDNGQPTFQKGLIRMKHSREELIDCVVPISKRALAKNREALFCYKSYLQTIKDSDILNKLGNHAYFEFFQEDYKPVASDVFEGIAHRK